MQEETNIRPLVDILSELTNEIIVMDKEHYVYLSSSKKVTQVFIDQAIDKQQKEQKYLKDMILQAKRKSEGESYTLNDTDYKVSFMKDDADGLMQVSMAFQLGLTETVIHFENGTKMPIKNTEFETFAIWFVGRRNSFFVGE